MTVDLTAAVDGNRPGVGDYLLAPPSSSLAQVYVVASTDGYMIRAVGAVKNKGVVQLENTWPRLAAAGFRLRTYEELQDGRLQTVVILGTLVFVSALAFVLAQPLSFVQAVSMACGLGFAFVAVVVLNSFRRDFFLNKHYRNRLGAGNGAAPGSA